MKKILTAEAATIIGTSPQFVRIAMQQGKLNIGTAVKMSSRWTYNISPTSPGDSGTQIIIQESDTTNTISATEPA